VTTPGRVRRLGALAVTGSGLTLALAATVAPLPPAAGAPGASLVVRLPDAARLLVLALLAGSVILLLGLQRPRRRPEDEQPESRDPRRPSMWAALLSLPILLSLSALVYLVWYRGYAGDGDPLRTAFARIAELLELLATARKAPTSSPVFDVAITSLAVLLSLAIFAAMVLITLADRLHRRAGQAVTETAPLDEAIADSLDDLRAESDPRVAIIRAYRRFEHALSAARAGRAPWQTPSEFMRAALARLPVPAPPVERLTTLFELARFSDRRLGAEARDAACDCLDEIQTALEGAAARAS
jgi:hypothetical protein